MTKRAPAMESLQTPHTEDCHQMYQYIEEALILVRDVRPIFQTLSSCRKSQMRQNQIFKFWLFIVSIEHRRSAAISIHNEEYRNMSTS